MKFTLKRFFPKISSWLSKKYNFWKNKIYYQKTFLDFSDQYIKTSRFDHTIFRSIVKNPKLGDDTINTPFDRHYIYHTAWAARKLYKSKPSIHQDIGSHLFFVTLVSAFIHIKHYDFRPPEIDLDNFGSKHEDLTNLSFNDNSISSLSCMHVIEHIGLGRYGDTIDPDGDLNAIDELIRVLAKNGNLYFVVPIGIPRIYFNAHRIYDPVWLVNYFKHKGLIIEEFAVIPDRGHLLRYQSPSDFCNQDYACGCYSIIKKE